MERIYFMNTARVAFSRWEETDLPLAQTLWGNWSVARYICAAGVFTPEEIETRLKTELSNGEQHGVQYWPIFCKTGGDFIGCCGLRPRSEGSYELGFHLLPRWWGMGIAREAAEAVIDYAFASLGAQSIFAGHNPKNVNSAKVIRRLGFEYTGDEFYAPTGLYHPSYRLCRKTPCESGQRSI